MSSTEYFKRLGAIICRRRVRAGLSPRDLVNERFYERYIHDVEYGLEPPSDDFLLYIAGPLETTPQELRGEAERAAGQAPASKEKDQHEQALMNAHVWLETERPAQALSFLEPLKPAALTVDLQVTYYRIRGQAEIALGNYRQGRADLKTAASLLKVLNETGSLRAARINNWIGLSYYYEGRYEQAIQIHRQCWQMIQDGEINDNRFFMMVCCNLGNEHMMQGQHDTAIQFYQQALRLEEPGEDHYRVAIAHWGLGLIYKKLGQFEAAAHELLESVSRFRLLDSKLQGMKKWTAQALDQYGLVLIEDGQHRRAEDALLEAFDLAGQAEDNKGLAFAGSNLAFLYWKTGRLDEAEIWGLRALEHCKRLGDNLALGQLQATLADIKLAQNDEQAGHDYYRAALATLEQSHDNIYLRQVYRRFYEVLKKGGHSEEAFAYIQKALGQ